MIELYNTRFGTNQTGRYRQGLLSADGFEPDSTSVDPHVLYVFHSADSSRDGRIALPELLRVIELYNTRFGTTRTGRYRLSESTDDGYEPESSSDEAADLASYHSADVDHDERFSLSELLRVIEIYNTRNGTTRTGAYRISGSTADGFSPDS